MSTRPDARGRDPSPWGMVHGRFQPFHNGHLAYLTAAAERCDRLLVGITNPDRLRTRAEAADATRHLPSSNPFTYTDRLLMVRAAAAAAGVGPVEVVPFPVSDPELWPDYVPAGTVHYLRVLGPWGAAKVERLRAHGHPVVVLESTDEAEVTGTRVRAAIRAGEDWTPLVPPAVAEVLRSLDTTRALAPRPAA